MRGHAVVYAIRTANLHRIQRDSKRNCRALGAREVGNAICPSGVVRCRIDVRDRAPYNAMQGVWYAKVR